MKKSLKGIICLALIAVMGFSGCGAPVSSDNQKDSNNRAEGSAAQQEQNANTENSGEKIKIVFWTNQRHDMAYLEPKIEEFNATNDKNIEVVCEIMTDNDEVRKYAKTITEKLGDQGVYGFAMNLKGAYSSLYRSVVEVARLSNMLYYDYKNGKYDFNEYSKVVKSFADIYADGSFFPGTESLDIDPLRTQFALGKIGMYMSGYWEIAVYQTQFPTEQKWAACQLPTYDGVVDGVNTTIPMMAPITQMVIMVALIQAFKRLRKHFGAYCGRRKKMAFFFSQY